MKTTIYNGLKRSQQLASDIKQVTKELANKKIRLKIASILFEEDAGSVLYTQIKQEMADVVGIDYEVNRFSLSDDIDVVLKRIKQLNKDETVNGIIIQKPWRSTWLKHYQQEEEIKSREEYQQWWESLVSAIELKKDVDGLHPETLKAIKTNTWKESYLVLPATCQAVLTIISDIDFNKDKKVIIIGRSQLLGLPLYYELKNNGFQVELIGRMELKKRRNEGKYLKDGDLIVSATGKTRLIKGSMIKLGSILIDVGEPRPDVDHDSIQGIAKLVTPVPGGVGPMTVVCLMQNCLRLTGYMKSL